MFPGPRLLSSAGCKSVLFIRPGGIGDAVLMVPAIRWVMERFPGCRIDVLAEKRNAGVFSLCPAVCEVLRYDRPAEILRAFARYYDVVIDTEQWHRLSAVTARFVRSRVKIGFDTNERRRMFHHPVGYLHERYEVESFFDLLEPLGVVPFDSPAPFLDVPESAACQADDALAGFDLPYVAIFPGASIAERRWGQERFRSLASKLSVSGLGVVVVGGTEDHAAGGAIVAGLENALNLAGNLSLAGTAAVIERSRLLVSGDSGVLHIAVGLDVPTVSLFGPGIVAKWAPRGAKHRVVNLELPCSPCTRFGTTPPCPIGAKCIQDISVDRVWREVQTFLDLTSGD